MDARTRPAALAGAVAAAAGLAVAELVAGVLNLGASPVLAVAEAVIAITLGDLAEAAIQLVGRADKPLLVAGTVLGALALGAVAGVLARRGLRRGLAVLVALGVLAVWATLSAEDGGPADAVTALVAVGVAALVLRLLLRRVPHPGRSDGAGGGDRRQFLLLAGATAAGAVAVAVAGRILGEGRRALEEARRALRLPVSRPPAPTEVAVDVEGVGPWQTPNEVFYRIDTALAVPEVRPEDWRLRIHGMVEEEVEVGYDELVGRDLEELWLTLTCVSNPVGGELIGNAWWSGVPVADLLERAGVSA